MHKIQVLLPEPVMRRLREVARREDRPLSELIRRATEGWLDRLPAHPPGPGERVELPAFDLGVRVTDPGRLKELVYERDGDTE